ncbi:cytochrome C biogenesis protein CcmA [Croceibacterium mercuriale]|uniref:Cytochrome C biogenesis protein CcmA n=1 Tax=Croceibacterium mercuriale TaxID=1572751 RepID=A0A0B2C362_9SPHN|nr:heme ABC exporter ATP-binding protein CcmA [Croceibacterium mercuriale]KHL26456.1 cytochrome C biogenesis protein CcmA [Croceibacterium mercuriale]
MQAALTATGLVCRRGDRLLWGPLDLAVRPGQALHLTGPNGIGKTSMLRIAAGLLRPMAGQVERDGSFALLDGAVALDEQQALGTALAFWQRLDPAAMPLERLGLDQLLDVPVRYLSTGQRKRAGLARLIGQGARHWLLDEPLNALDDAGVALVEALIAERQAAGGAVIVASHQPIRLCDAAVLDLRTHAA